MKRYDLTVADLMSTAVITVKVDDPINEAHAEMEMGVVRHLPVVDDRGRLVGVVSDRDILRSVATKKAHYVRDIMVQDVVTLPPETPAHIAASMMMERQISSILIVDDTATLVGLVTQTDYVEVGRRALLGLPLERA